VSDEVGCFLRHSVYSVILHGRQCRLGTESFRTLSTCLVMTTSDLSAVSCQSLITMACYSRLAMCTLDTE